MLLIPSCVFRWIGTRRTTPALDTSQDLTAQMAVYENGVLTIRFSCPRDTGDTAQDRAFTDTDCYYFFYPFSGGAITGGTPGYHTQIPDVSTDKICVKACPATTPTTTPEPEPEPSKASYHLTGLVWIMLAFLFAC